MTEQQHLITPSPSLKEKGLTSLAKLEEQGLCPDLVNEIRQALEQLND
jgi:hypothetical protein